MASKNDLEIVRLIKSESVSERNNGGLLFEKMYKSKSLSFLRKHFKDLSFEDIWQEAASDMVVCIRNGKYKPVPEASMFTYFYYILRSIAIKEANRMGLEKVISDEMEIEEFNKYYDPEYTLELLEFRRFFSECLERFEDPYKQLLINIYREGIRLKDFFSDLGIGTYNNAKVKHHTAKQKLLNCLKSKMKNGKTR